MKMPKILGNSKVTEVDTSIKKILAAYQKRNWTSDLHLVGLFTYLQQLSEKLTATILKQKNKIDLAQLDKKRDDSITGFYHLLQGYIRYENEEVQEATKTVLSLFDSYSLSIRSESYAVESSLIDSLLDQLEEPKIAESIEKLPGVSLFVKQLYSTQTSFKVSQVTLDEMRAKEAQSLSATKIKREIITHFNGTVQLYMNAMSNVDESTYGELSRIISQIISDNNHAVKKRRINN